MFSVRDRQWKLKKRATIQGTEENLLKKYCGRVGGVSFVEVPLGDEEYHQKDDRKIDAIRFLRHHKGRNIITCSVQNFTKFEDRLRSADEKREKVQIIEVKRDLNRSVIGQVIVGEYLVEEWERREGLKHRAVLEKVVICGTEVRILKAFCTEYDIQVWSPPRAKLKQRTTDN